MKQTKTSSLYRLVAFLLITIVLIGIVGVVADGARQSDTNDQTPPTADQLGSETDKNDGNSNQQTTQTPLPELPKYKHYLTGLPTDEQTASQIPLVYAIDPTSPLYGVSASHLTVELATEMGESRMLLYLDQNTSIGKIGAIAPMRAYINKVASYFGGIQVHNGTDDKLCATPTDSKSAQIDLSSATKYAYSEGVRELYTNGQLIASAMENARIPTKYASPPTLPFSFYDTPTTLGSSATTVTIPYGKSNVVSLRYDTLTQQYRMYRSDEAVVDPLTQEAAAYTNVLVLFCDALTYENADRTETALDTASGGSGYYLTMGTYQKILWSTDEGGNLVFTDTAGTRLSLNAGASYLSFFKVSQKSDVVLGK